MRDGARKLILFDVDGTLISTQGRAGRALATAITEVFGVTAPMERYRLSGKTDPQIVFELMELCGFPRERVVPHLDRVLEAYLSRLDAALPAEHVNVLPGVREVLEALAARTDVRVGLLTGNVQPGAALKIERAGLSRHFEVGAFGSDQEDRNLLVPVARARASARWGEAFEGSRTVVVGDAEADIRCARAGGARAVAVATGGTSPEVLAALRPDALLPNLADPSTLASLLDGHPDPTAD
jgi:phosphoglycolate phosphatase